MAYDLSLHHSIGQLKKPLSGKALKNFKCKARPGTHLFPEVQYIRSKHKKVSAGQCRSVVSLREILNPALFVKPNQSGALLPPQIGAGPRRNWKIGGTLLSHYFQSNLVGKHNTNL
jgi:hypothetical protein